MQDHILESFRTIIMAIHIDNITNRVYSTIFRLSLTERANLGGGDRTPSRRHISAGWRAPASKSINCAAAGSWGTRGGGRSRERRKVKSNGAWIKQSHIEYMESDIFPRIWRNKCIEDSDRADPGGSERDSSALIISILETIRGDDGMFCWDSIGILQGCRFPSRPTQINICGTSFQLMAFDHWFCHDPESHRVPSDDLRISETEISETPESWTTKERCEQPCSRKFQKCSTGSIKGR
uniref:Uncharacterized protein n=1 Tax=Steinernema glaseri TaxID=37863 RepID=A0A1I8AEM0_9BILA